MKGDENGGKVEEENWVNLRERGRGAMVEVKGRAAGGCSVVVQHCWRVEGLGFGVWGLGCGVWGLGAAFTCHLMPKAPECRAASAAAAVKARL